LLFVLVLCLVFGTCPTPRDYMVYESSSSTHEKSGLMTVIV
jgi:hypothetical protein